MAQGVVVVLDVDLGSAGRLHEARSGGPRGHLRVRGDLIVAQEGDVVEAEAPRGEHVGARDVALEPFGGIEGGLRGLSR